MPPELCELAARPRDGRQCEQIRRQQHECPFLLDRRGVCRHWARAQRTGGGANSFDRQLLESAAEPIRSGIVSLCSYACHFSTPRPLPFPAVNFVWGKMASITDLLPKWHLSPIPRPGNTSFTPCCPSLISARPGNSLLYNPAHGPHKGEARRGRAIAGTGARCVMHIPFGSLWLLTASQPLHRLCLTASIVCLTLRLRCGARYPAGCAPQVSRVSGDQYTRGRAVARSQGGRRLCLHD